MKKLLSLVLVMLMLCSVLAACSSEPVEKPTDPATEPTQTQEPTEPPAEEPTDASAEEPSEEPVEAPDEPPAEEPVGEPAEAGFSADSIIRSGNILTIGESIDGYPDHVELPLAEEMTTLECWFAWGYPYTLLIEDPNDTPAQQEAEALTNVHIDWELANDAAAQFPLMLVSEDFTDIYVSGANYANLPNYADDEIIVDLTELIPTLAPNYAAVRQSDEDFARRSITDDGRLLAFSNMMTTSSVTWMSYITRTDWLGDRDPVTYDDFEEVLISYRDEFSCPNPLNIEANGQDMHFMAGFDVGTSWIVVDGQVVHSITQPGYRGYLEKMNKWYTDGLLDSEFYGRDPHPSRDYEATVSGEFGMWYEPYQYMDLVESFSEDPNFSLIGVRPPVQQEGDIRKIQLTSGSSRFDSRYGAIFASCSDIELAVKFFDFWYTTQGSMYAVYGIEDLSYVIDEEGIPQLTDVILHPTQAEVTSNMARLSYIAESWPCLTDWTRDLKAGLSENELETIARWDYNWEDTISMPSLTLTAEEAEDYSYVMGDIETRINETIVRYITGEYSMDTWDAFVEELTSMGLDEARDIQQAAYERFMSR